MILEMPTIVLSFGQKEKYKASSSVGLCDLAGTCFRREKCSIILSLLQMSSSFRAYSADCERGFHIINRFKTKNRCRLDPYPTGQLMMVKSALATASETTYHKRDNELAISRFNNKPGQSA